MSNFELIKQLLNRLKKFSWLIILIAIIFCAGFVYLSKQGVTVFNSKFTVFPLNSTSDNTISSSAISNILGLADAPKSFTGDASINIVELASSRRTREAVAATRIPSLGNKTVAELLIDEHNAHTGFMKNVPIETKKLDSIGIINIASSMLGGTFNCKVGKNGILELFFYNSNPKIVEKVSYAFIDKISEFYISLKKKKALIDYQFAVQKADSLRMVLNGLDRRMISLDESTFFTNQELLRYSIPKQNTAQDKATVQSQYYYAVNNREAAAYKLQKETPIIEILDKPEGPYNSASKSPKMYGILGFLLGAFIGIILISWKVINYYIQEELNRAIAKASKPKAITTPIEEEATKI